MLMRFANGERKVWSVARAPTVQDEDDRQLHRELLSLKSEQTRHVNGDEGVARGLGTGGRGRGPGGLRRSSMSVPGCCRAARPPTWPGSGSSWTCGRSGSTGGVRVGDLRLACDPQPAWAGLAQLLPLPSSQFRPGGQGTHAVSSRYGQGQEKVPGLISRCGPPGSATAFEEMRPGTFSVDAKLGDWKRH
jgi:hypothetical protein